MSKVISKDNIFPENKDVWFEGIMSEYGDRLTKLAYNYTKDWNLAEDIVQDVFIACYKEYENIDKIISFKAWIFRITINKCKDLLKSSLFKRVVTNSNLLTFTKSSELPPEMVLIKNSEEEYLSTCVLELPIKYREVITLYYYEELSIEEISEILKINKNTIKTRMSRARVKLKILLERWR
ncbi:sigma-70 family RNA polymerase sigma factor [Lederbergia panacisoli]|uniref:sigma-70 family RNA polymerase sigma factor n=1 Tax=Lederbergia panacisoli TaxID=1255251 RepID=UPI00214AE2F0|nr:sigma-70 family RNA polymerase sigma factor [Lederbergia panacisoli]MCR2823632.1 sigma-70 family RNA polymerase sigma factor [Lederbergia panacisoli]